MADELPARVAVLGLVPAAGRGERFAGGDGPPKQFREIAGRPLLAWTLERLVAAGVERLVVAVPADWLGWAERHLGGSGSRRFIAGGASRQQSVERCLEVVPGPDEELILVHDGARPATATSDVRATLRAAEEAGGAVLGRPVHDTLKRLTAGGWLGETVPREGLFRAETPQVFRRGLLVAGYAAATARGVEATDEAGVVELLPEARIRAVVASAPNPKLTCAADVALVTALLGGASR